MGVAHVIIGAGAAHRLLAKRLSAGPTLRLRSIEDGRRDWYAYSPNAAA